MARVTIFSTANCAFCVRAKSAMVKWGIDFDDIAVDTDDAAHQEFTKVTQGARTVPQILIDGKLIGGYTDMMALHKSGDLDSLM